MLKALKEQFFALKDLLKKDIDSFKSKKVQELHVEYLLRLTEKSIYVIAATFFAPLFTEKGYADLVYPLIGGVGIALVIVARNYAYTLQERVEAQETKQLTSKFSRRSKLRG